jgi:hypothetical protein
MGGESEGQGSSCPTHSWGSAGPEGLWAEGYPTELLDLLWPGVPPGQGVGIPALCGSGSGLEAGAAEGQLSPWCMDLAGSERPGSCHAWVRCGAVAWSSLKGREASRREQRLCRPTGWGFGRTAVLLLDHGVEKPSTI